MTKLHCVAAALLAAFAVPAVGQDTEHAFGVWQNPSRSVHVRAEACGDGMCGVVVWADDKAQHDARRAGTAQLIGLQLFRNFVPEKRGRWRGKVFIPDIGMTFSGTITMLNDQTMIGTGCLIGHFICKSQTWTRLSD